MERTRMPYWRVGSSTRLRRRLRPWRRAWYSLPAALDQGSSFGGRNGSTTYGGSFRQRGDTGRHRWCQVVLPSAMIAFFRVSYRSFPMPMALTCRSMVCLVHNGYTYRDRTWERGGGFYILILFHISKSHLWRRQKNTVIQRCYMLTRLQLMTVMYNNDHHL